MKHKILIIISLSLFICSCSNIPDKSVFESLSTNELAKIIRKDTMFANFYEGMQKVTSEFSEIEKAKFYDITYRRLYEVISNEIDTVKFNHHKQKWFAEWDSEFAKYDVKVDSVTAYWTKYKQENSLDRFVDIKFSELNKEYYSFSNDVQNVNIGFSLTPLQGEVEQIKFNYRYRAKINSDFGEFRACLSTEPFASSVVNYWMMEYSDEVLLKNISTSEFNRDYDVEIAITDIRKDGINHSMSDLNIPESVFNVLNNDSLSDPFLYNLYREDIVKELLCKEYKDRWSYMKDKYDEFIKNTYPREYMFIEYIRNMQLD